MNKKTVVVGLAFSIALSTMGMAFGQTRSQLLGTPQQRARYDEAARLAGASAKALRAGNYAEAETDARQALSRYASIPMARKYLAAALNAQGKTQEALEAYKVLADENSYDPRDLLPYSQLLLKTGHWVQAVTAFNKVLPRLSDPFSGSRAALISSYAHLSPAMPQPRELETALHLALGISYDGTDSDWGQSQDSKSLLEYARAYAFSPTSAVATLFEGRRLWKLHRFTEANVAFAKAAKLDNGQVRTAAQQAMR